MREAKETPKNAPAASGGEPSAKPAGGQSRPDSGASSRRESRGDQQRSQRKRFVRRFHRRKVCRFCVAKVEYIDYKDARRLKRFISDRGKILPRRVTGCCAHHQRMLTTALKRARNIALLPYKAD